MYAQRGTIEREKCSSLVPRYPNCTSISATHVHCSYRRPAYDNSSIFATDPDFETAHLQKQETRSPLASSCEPNGARITPELLVGLPAVVVAAALAFFAVSHRLAVFHRFEVLCIWLIANSVLSPVEFPGIRRGAHHHAARSRWNDGPAPLPHRVSTAEIARSPSDLIGGESVLQRKSVATARGCAVCWSSGRALQRKWQAVAWPEALLHYP